MQRALANGRATFGRRIAGAAARDALQRCMCGGGSALAEAAA